MRQAGNANARERGQLGRYGEQILELHALRKFLDGAYCISLEYETNLRDEIVDTDIADANHCDFALRANTVQELTASNSKTTLCDLAVLLSCHYKYSPGANIVSFHSRHAHQSDGPLRMVQIFVRLPSLLVPTANEHLQLWQL